MKVLISAYSCEPNHGSEPAAGWNWACAAAREHDVLVLTRTRSRPAIEAELARNPQPRLRFHYLDPPFDPGLDRPGGSSYLVHYLAWQVLAARATRRLERHERFDVAHHLTFANLWLPALVCVSRAPFLLGPVGGAPRVPVRLYRTLGLRGIAREVLRALGMRASRCNPLTRLGWRRAQVIVAQNHEAVAALPRRHRAKAVIRPHASVVRPPAVGPVRREPTPTAVYAGRLVPQKGVGLAIKAMTRLPEWRLHVIGSGPEAERLRRLAVREGVAERVGFTPKLSQEGLWQRMAEADALVLPSLRDDAPFVAAEAQTLGVPVVAFAQGGPAVLAELPGSLMELVPLGREQACVDGLADALRKARHGRAAAAPADFGLDGVQRDLDALYARAARAGENGSTR